MLAFVGRPPRFRTASLSDRLAECLPLLQVILALSDASSGGSAKVASHVPYRDSTLTRLLKHALGGNSHTLMLACISPSDLQAEENASTLAYAARARAITNAPVMNTDPHTAQVNQLRSEIERLKAEIQRLQMIIELGGLAAAGAGAAGGAHGTDPCSHQLLVGHVGTGHGTCNGRPEASPASPLTPSRSLKDDQSGGGGGGGGVSSQREAALSQRLAKEAAAAQQQGAALQRALALAKQLAATNTQLRQAFDALAAKRDALEAEHGLLLVENTQQRERVGLLELALAMESYPSAPHDSLHAQIEQQLRAAAQEVVALRHENAHLRDQLGTAQLGTAPLPKNPELAPAAAIAYGQPAPPTHAAPPTQRKLKASDKGSALSGSLAEYGALQRPSQRGNAPAPAPAAPVVKPEPPPPAQPTLSLSSTGGLLATSAWMLPVPVALEKGTGPRPTSAGRTVPKLMPAGSTVEELDQLAILMRKRAELSAQQRPSTAAPMGARFF